MQHDDTDRLQAMLDRGEPIIGGEYRTSRPLVLRDGAELDCTITHAGDIGLDVQGVVKRLNARLRRA